jgi:uncharacterized membrane protein YdbT with pleckstrin-like domain
MSFAKRQLLPEEKLITVAHQHLLVLARPILLNVLALIVLAGIAVFTLQYWILLLLILPLGFLLWRVLLRQRREYIITDRRVVKLDGVFAVTSFDASLDKVNNVFHKQSVWGRVFKYGDVGLETASEQGTTIFQCIPDPVGFKNHIVRQREAYKTGGRQPAPETPQDIPKMLENLALLRDRNIISAAEFEEKKKSLLNRM